MGRNREQLAKEFSVDEHGLIADQGKFEREPLYVPYFWSTVLDGFGEDVYAEPENDDEENEDFESELLYTLIDIDEDDINEFPELKGYKAAKVFQSDAGFVTVELIGDSA